MSNLEQKIKYLCKLKNITLKKFSVELGISEPTLYNFFEKNDMSLQQVKKNSKFFSVPLSFFDDEVEEVKEISKPIPIDKPTQEINQSPEYWRKKYLREKKDKLFFRGLLEK